MWEKYVPKILYTEKPKRTGDKSTGKGHMQILQPTNVWVGSIRVYLRILMTTLIFNDIWYSEQVSKRIF